MQRMRTGLWLLLVLLLWISFPLQAQQQAVPTTAPQTGVPRLIKFAGNATDAGGKALSGTLGVTLAIYKDQYEGAPLWLETQNIQADAKGNYTVQLGATKPDGLPLDLFSSGDARWVGVTVNGGQEQPRVLLLSVPYALKASDAETIGGLPPSAFVLANKTQSTTSGTKPAPTAPNTKNALPPVNPAVTGKGTLDFIPMWDSTSDIVNSLIFQKSSQIGINTIAPAVTLDVNGKSDVRDTLTLFPKGTDSTLAVNGTNFKVDQTGKVTFISGQTFPGAGTVSSVGLSAPSSDFKVTGSPVTKSGTLNLNWNVAPTSNDAANAIVKRDASGNFSGGFITGNLGVFGLSSGPATVAAGIIGSNTSSGSGVFGTSASGFGIFGTSTSGVGIWGSSSGTSGGSDGVHGVTSSAGASGVAGINNSGGIGVYGTGGVGVFGTGSSYGMQTDSNVQQARTAGGWVKAMVYYSGNNSGQIATCFNSTLSGAAATTPPCGFAQTKNNVGDYTIDFGFEVDDRFFSLTQQGGLGDLGEWLTACTVFTGNCVSGLSQNQVHVFSIGSSGDADSKFYLIVY